MKVFFKLFLFIVSLSVFAFTASAHCGSCEGDTSHDEHAKEVTHHDGDADHHETDDHAADKGKHHEEDTHGDDGHHDDTHH